MDGGWLRLILLSDANVLIDLGYVDGLDILCHLGQVEVLDVVLQECEYPAQPSLVDTILAVGIHEIQTQREWVSQAQRYRTGNLSLQDVLNLYYAKAFGRCLLTNEKLLREQCQLKDVAVHGTLWVIQESARKQLRTATQLCKWLKVLPTLDRRLPSQEINRLKKELKCL